jgi:hypothetical protein
VEDEEAIGLREVMSPERLAPYQQACRGDLIEALRLYAWNVEISAAFHGPLGCLEVALRNAMHRQLALHFVRDDWWSAPQVSLHWVAQRKIEEARQEISRRHRVVTPGRMVAELSLGFWVSLLGSGVDYETRLWRPALHHAFPGYHGRRTPLHREFDYMRSFRNRIAHHEPIYRRHLEADHKTLLELIGYLSTDLAAWVRRHDRVPAVLSCRDRVCAGIRPTSF